MTRKGTAKPVDGMFAEGRLRMARAYPKAARTEMTVAEPEDLGNPAMSQIVNAAIAFTASYAGRANQQDHAARSRRCATHLATAAECPGDQSAPHPRREGRRYGARHRTQDDAKALLGRLQEFATWAEAELARSH